MTFVPVPEGVKVDLIQSQFGQVITNVLWFQVTAAHTPINLDTIALQAKTAWNARIKPQVGSWLSLTSVVATSQETQNGAVGIATFAPIPGTGTVGDPVPGNSAVVVTLKTDQRGRSYRGRIYQAGIGDNVGGANANEIGLTYAGTLAAIWADFDGDMVGGTVPAQISVCSRFHNKAPRVSGVLTDVSAYSVNIYRDSQRRRLTGRGT